MILISPWSRPTTDGKTSPKNYPHWNALVEGLLRANHEVTQVSCSGEADVAGAKRLNDLPLAQVAELMKTCDTWISVDNFWHHMAWTLKVPGIVIFGLSDPEIFGHPENINILKDRRFLRVRQFGLWSQQEPNPEAFVGPGAVLEAVRLALKRKKSC